MFVVRDKYKFLAILHIKVGMFWAHYEANESLVKLLWDHSNEIICYSMKVSISYEILKEYGTLDI